MIIPIHCLFYVKKNKQVFGFTIIPFSSIFCRVFTKIAYFTLHPKNLSMHKNLSSLNKTLLGILININIFFVLYSLYFWSFYIYLYVILWCTQTERWKYTKKIRNEIRSSGSMSIQSNNWISSYWNWVRGLVPFRRFCAHLKARDLFKLKYLVTY